MSVGSISSKSACSYAYQSAFVRVASNVRSLSINFGEIPDGCEATKLFSAIGEMCKGLRILRVRNPLPLDGSVSVDSLFIIRCILSTDLGWLRSFAAIVREPASNRDCLRTRQQLEPNVHAATRRGGWRVITLLFPEYYIFLSAKESRE